MECWMLWHGGSSYAAPCAEDAEHFTTPRSLFEDITGMDAHAEATWAPDAYQAMLEGLCSAYERGVSDTFEFECERILHAAL